MCQGPDPPGASQPKVLTNVPGKMLMATEVVFAKRPISGPAIGVLLCLSRYIHRVASSNSRLMAHFDGWVTSGWIDHRAHGGTCNT